MTNISVPIQKEYLEYIDAEIEKGDFDSRSQFIRNAIKKMIEEKEIAEIHEASKMAKLGEIFEGDIDQLVKKVS